MNTETTRNWDDPNGNVLIRDGETTCRAKFRAHTSLHTILHEYLRTYGYCDLDQALGLWWEGEIERGGEITPFWARPEAATGHSHARHTIRFSRPYPGEVRHDGYRY